jgi:hypothetical protein
MNVMTQKKYNILYVNMNIQLNNLIQPDYI